MCYDFKYHLYFQLHIHRFDVFTEKPYSKPLERNLLYIPIITTSLATSVTSEQTMALYNLVGRRRCLAVKKKQKNLRVNVILLQF